MGMLGNLWHTLHPLGSRLMGGQGAPTPPGQSPQWHPAGPGRWELEGGGLPNHGNLFPPTGGPGQVGGLAPMNGGGAPLPQFPGLPPMMTGGPNQPMGGFNGLTGGGAPRSSYQLPDFQADPYGGGFRGNFGLGAFR